MNEVMNKAQELAMAILNSETYTKMHQLELQLAKDGEATAAIADMAEKRKNVEDLLASADMDPEVLAKAADAMEEAEKKMNAVPIIREAKESRNDFNQMMNNVNRILRLVITGETEEEAPSGCTGNCASCGGCH